MIMMRIKNAIDHHAALRALWRSKIVLIVALVASQFAIWAAQPKNSVLIITLDTTRADRLGVYGNRNGLTPSLDMLASKCTVFEHCYAAIPQTFPSHLTIFSGWDPDHHGVRKNMETFVPPKVPLLAEEFEKQGYATGAFVSSMVLLGNFGLGRGFETYDSDFYDPKLHGAEERPAAETCSHAWHWIKEQKAPWFCWIHLYDPHFPYNPPPPYSLRYKTDPYDGEVAYMDAALGGLFARLQQIGLLANTLIVVCGDHGESLGEHGEDTHSIFLYDATTRVPFLVHLPDQEHGQKVRETVGLVDIAPTIRDILGFEPISGSDGVSLRPLLEGQKMPSHTVYIESLEPLYSFGWAPLFALVDGRFKFILAPRPEFYDVMKDPRELDNLYTPKLDRANQMKKVLQSRLKAAKPLEGGKIRLDSEEMRSLQSLGYISGTTGVGGATYRDPKDGTEVMKLHMKAMGFFTAGKFEQAAVVFGEIMQKDPKNPLNLYCLARCYEKKEPAKSIAFYKRSLSVRPDFPQAYSRLLLMYLSHDMPQDGYALGKVAITEVEDLDGLIHALTAWAALKSGHAATEVRSIVASAKRGGEGESLLLRDEAALALQEGDKEATLKKLNDFAEVAPAEDVAVLDKEPLFAGLKEEPRFWVLVLKARQQITDHREH